MCQRNSFLLQSGTQATQYLLCVQRPISFPEPAFFLANAKKRSSGIIYFPESQILGSGFRAHACQSWRPNAPGEIQLPFKRKLGKTQTFFLKEQQYEYLKEVGIEKKNVLAVLPTGSKIDNSSSHIQ